MVIKVGEKWCQATKTWKFWLNFLAKSLFFSRYPRFSPFERPDAYRCYTFSESYGSRETRDIKSSTSKFDIEARGILSSLSTQTGPWSDTASYVGNKREIFLLQQLFPSLSCWPDFFGRLLRYKLPFIMILPLKISFMRVQPRGAYVTLAHLCTISL